MSQETQQKYLTRQVLSESRTRKHCANFVLKTLCQGVTETKLSVGTGNLHCSWVVECTVGSGWTLDVSGITFRLNTALRVDRLGCFCGHLYWLTGWDVYFVKMLYTCTSLVVGFSFALLFICVWLTWICIMVHFSLHKLLLAGLVIWLLCHFVGRYIV